MRRRMRMRSRRRRRMRRGVRPMQAADGRGCGQMKSVKCRGIWGCSCLWSDWLIDGVLHKPAEAPLSSPDVSLLWSLALSRCGLPVELKRSYVTWELLSAAVGPREPDLVRVQLCLGPCDFGKCSKVKKKWLKMKCLQLETWSAGQIDASVCFTCSSSSSSRICYQNILEGGGVIQKLSARWGGTNMRRHWWIISEESIRNQEQKAEHGHWPAHWSYTARVMLSYTCLSDSSAGDDFIRADL